MHSSATQRALEHPPSPRPDLAALTAAEIRALCELAVNGLVPMFDVQEKLFCHRLRHTPHGLAREGVSPRYTAMTLLGLHAYRQRGGAIPIDPGPVLDRLCGDNSWATEIGDVGLLLWLCAVASPDRLKDNYFRFKVNHAFASSKSVHQRRTMELAWFLTGLSHAEREMPRSLPSVADLAIMTFRLLASNAGPSCFFGHSSRWNAPAGLLRGHIGSFADQVYPIYALTRFWQAFRIDEARQLATGCAEAICRAQGELGQWWWHYDAHRGEVAERYPVYSVHQDGMAPMALLALGEATGLDFRTPIHRGLRWITGQNELACDLQDGRDHLIWRSIRPRASAFTKVLKGIRFAGWQRQPETAEQLAVLLECRPYHLGWLLYALSDQAMQAGA